MLKIIICNNLLLNNVLTDTKRIFLNHHLSPIKSVGRSLYLQSQHRLLPSYFATFGTLQSACKEPGDLKRGRQPAPVSAQRGSGYVALVSVRVRVVTSLHVFTCLCVSLFGGLCFITLCAGRETGLNLSKNPAPSRGFLQKCGYVF